MHHDATIRDVVGRRGLLEVGLAMWGQRAGVVLGVRRSGLYGDMGEAA